MSTAVLDSQITFEALSRGVSRAVSAAAEPAIFTGEALELIAQLHRQFEPRRQDLLAQRKLRQAAWDAGEVPTYLDRNSPMVTGDWKVADIPADLTRRRVEITGPVNSTKMVINMLSRTADGHRADCAMLDFEDSMKPSWKNVMDGVRNVIGAAEGNLSHVEPAKAGKPEKVYRLNHLDMPVVMVRARGLHLDESNLRVDDTSVSGGLLDLSLCVLHSARKFMALGKTPKFYIPKVEHHLEARWWNDLFSALERQLELPKSTLRATFLIETLPAAFQIEEILYELREHAVGLNVGRWDKIFSDIKTLRAHADRVMADRATINLSRDWMANYARRLIHICHSRGAFALGGMAAFTPGKDADKRQEQTNRVAADKQQEADWGHDGCWVSHPYFIGTAMTAFPKQNQLDYKGDPNNKYPDLLPRSEGPKTLAGLRTNLRVGIAYLYGWQQDLGCIAWDDLMEDLATLEISRAQVWQWLHHGVSLDDGSKVTEELLRSLFNEELNLILKELGKHAMLREWVKAKEAAETLFLQRDFQEFLSLASDIVPAKTVVA